MLARSAIVASWMLQIAMLAALSWADGLIGSAVWFCFIYTVGALLHYWLSPVTRIR